jgi:hypothetical protein
MCQLTATNRHAALIMLFCVISVGSLNGCVTAREFSKSEVQTRNLLLEIEQDRSKVERDIAVANLKYQQANELEKVSITADIAQHEAKLAELDAIKKTADEAIRLGKTANSRLDGMGKTVAEIEQQRRDEERAAQEAIRKSNQAMAEYKAYQSQAAQNRSNARD